MAGLRRRQRGGAARGEIEEAPDAVGPRRARSSARGAAPTSPSPSCPAAAGRGGGRPPASAPTSATSTTRSWKSFAERLPYPFAVDLDTDEPGPGRDLRADRARAARGDRGPQAGHQHHDLAPARLDGRQLDRAVRDLDLLPAPADPPDPPARQGRGQLRQGPRRRRLPAARGAGDPPGRPRLQPDAPPHPAPHQPADRDAGRGQPRPAHAADPDAARAGAAGRGRRPGAGRPAAGRGRDVEAGRGVPGLRARRGAGERRAHRPGAPPGEHAAAGRAQRRRAGHRHGPPPGGAAAAADRVPPLPGQPGRQRLPVRRARSGSR